MSEPDAISPREPRFVALRAGALAIGHRPPLRRLQRMREAGVTHIVTVLAESEQPQAIADGARAAGLEWLWVELGSTRNLPARGKPQIASALEAIQDILDGGGRAYLHCSAGIHRTGMIAAALLFRLGMDDGEVRAALAALRPVTALEMGEARFDWARSFRSPPDPPAARVGPHQPRVARSRASQSSALPISPRSR